MIEPQLTPFTVSNLTRRQREVLVTLATGASNREIGEALYVCEKTVKQHVSEAMRKLGARNRTHLAVMYVAATHDSNGDLSPSPVPPASAGVEQEMQVWPGGTVW